MNISVINWEEHLNVGYPLIDGHHKKLVSLINDFGKLLSLPATEYKKKVGKVLKSLIDYTIYHFNEEEQIMEKYKYPELANHKLLHNNFVSKLQESLIPLLKGVIIEGVDFYNFLRDWLLNHIAVTDKKWASYIHENFSDAIIE